MICHQMSAEVLHERLEMDLPTYLIFVLMYSPLRVRNRGPIPSFGRRQIMREPTLVNN